MTMTMQAAPRLADGTPVHLTAAAPALWRVIDGAGRVIGHLQALAGDAGIRFRARRFHPGSGFRDLGDFWSPDDAVACLRYSR